MKRGDGKIIRMLESHYVACDKRRHYIHPKDGGIVLYDGHCNCDIKEARNGKSKSNNQ